MGYFWCIQFERAIASAARESTCAFSSSVIFSPSTMGLCSQVLRSISVYAFIGKVLKSKEINSGTQ